MRSEGLFSLSPCPLLSLLMPHTSLREAAPTTTLSTSAQCPMPYAPISYIQQINKMIIFLANN